MKVRTRLLSGLIGGLLASTLSHASGIINPNAKYVGYMWIDAGNVTANNTLSVDQVHAQIGHSTNLNVVHTIDNLNANMCTSQRCAVGISAGLFHGNTGRLDICESNVDGQSLSYSECVNAGSWSNIWSIAHQVAAADNTPRAIYFVDEPELQTAFHDDSGFYIRYSYPSYVCTLRQALNANGLGAVKIFTILSDSADKNSLNPGKRDIIADVTTQMPASGCQGVSSTPDWMGFDNYNWTTPQSIRNKYLSNFGGSQLKWVIVPPATIEHNLADDATGTPSDTVLRNKLQAYWDYLASDAFEQDPVIYYSLFRYDPRVTSDAATAQQWSTSRSLLKYMSNNIFDQSYDELFNQ